MDLISRFRYAGIALGALLTIIGYLLGCQGIMWLNTGHLEVITVYDALSTLHLPYLAGRWMPMGDCPLWLLLLVPAAFFAIQFVEAAGDAREYLRMERRALGGQSLSRRRRGY